MPTVIQDPATLAQLCERLAGAPWVALDTEFTRESTYYAKLGLLQLATDEFICCVDPLAVDPSPLLKVLETPSMTKVLHAARQDLEVLYDLRKQVLAPVFDTQIAAALLGYADQVGYATLVEAVTQVKLPKLHTRTNWERRPLSPEQLHYAEDDVRYLRDVYHRLAHELRERQRESWLWEECRALTDAGLYQNDPALSYRRLKPGRPLAPEAQARLQALAAWRERTAQQLNRPRGWIVVDVALMEIARRAPADMKALEQVPELTRTQIAEHGDALLNVTHAAGTLPAQPLWPETVAPTPAEERLAKAMLARLEVIAKTHGLQPVVLGARRAVHALLHDRAGPLAHGWRWEVAGKELAAMTANTTPH